MSIAQTANRLIAAVSLHRLEWEADPDTEGGIVAQVGELESADYERTLLAAGLRVSTVRDDERRHWMYVAPADEN